MLIKIKMIIMYVLIYIRLMPAKIDLHYGNAGQNYIGQNQSVLINITNFES